MEKHDHSHDHDHPHRPGRGHGDQKEGAGLVASVITVSDRSARGERADASGPRAVELLTEAGYEVRAVVVPDGRESVGGALTAAVAAGADVVITSGGTGVGPRDLTPEGTVPLIERELPGVAELLRREGASHTPMAVISRGVVGVTGGERPALIANLPGSIAAVEQGLAVLLPIVPHIVDQLRGGDH